MRIPLLFLQIVGQTILSLHTISAQETCQDVNFSVRVHKTAAGDFTNATYSSNVLYSLAAKEILVSNSYNLSARLCRGHGPDTNDHLDTLQVLLHGASFNKNMWDATYQPENYSWVQRMNAAGYATLAVDLIGNGNSSFPDGLLEAQTQTYVSVMHHLIQQIRQRGIGNQRWKKIAFVGFSIGAIVANSLAEQFPNDVDSIILHGISWDSSWIYPAFLSGLQAPAQQIDPVKWGHIQPYYQTQSTREGRKVACFAGSFDPKILEYDWQSRDFDSLGAAMTFVYHLVTAPKYTGPVFLGIGSLDTTFCGGPICGSQPYQLYDRFPKASAHDIRVYPETGHLILFHHSGKQLMEDSLSFLRRQRF